jgi:predicted outer membrane protein
MLGLKRLGLLAALVVVGLAPAAAQAAAQPSTQDTQYLQALHQVNLFEITTGNLAQQKGQNQQVKDLGAQFVTDHTQLDQTVQETARQLNVQLPDSPTDDQQKVIDNLNGLSDAEFDKAWVTAELTGHVQAIQATQTEISQGSEQSVVQLAQNALPVLQAHYDALVALAQTLGVPVPQASASGTPSPGGTATTPAPGGTTESPAPGGTTESPAPGGTESPAPGTTEESPAPGVS